MCIKSSQYFQYLNETKELHNGHLMNHKLHRGFFKIKQFNISTVML